MDARKRSSAASNRSIRESNPAYLSSVAHSPLFKLPRELRDYIYEYAFCDPPLIVTKHGGIPEPALLFTCNIIRDEAILAFYGREKRLVLFVDSYNPAVLRLWYMKQIHLKRSHGFLPSNINHRHVGIRNWNNLKRTLQLRHAHKIKPFKSRPPGSPRYTDEKFFIVGLFTMAEEMEDRSWEAVEIVLDMLRPGLVKLHQDWAL
jgi:hypothetical protein